MHRVIAVDVLSPTTKPRQAEQSQAELERLIDTYGGLMVVKKVQKRQSPDYRTYLGKGKLEEIKGEIAGLEADILVFNNILRPQQIWHIEEFLRPHKIQVWDRVDLILKIFAKHAQTTEAKLQIELAAIKHMGPRIFGMGMELSRQGGGIGTRGIGETNTEIMKRHLAEQEEKIRGKIQKYHQMHQQQIANRQRKNLNTIAILGYTNAGKSQLLTALTRKEVKVKDELFATLDTRTGSLYLPELEQICLISDTIGFIQDLPPQLISAFKTTLAEALSADLILMVVDYPDRERDHKIQVVLEILEELGVAQKPIILVANKMDLIKNPRTQTFQKKYQRFKPVFVSALKSQNLETLRDDISNFFKKNISERILFDNSR
ncbi:MAG TPA: GTPase HflX [Candidatus Gracilibacteria bacterium]|nr:GTPase HflX [Candidatus Gracilibacteria bacterium]